jgi:nucleotide-binding universal stress UspA family protein
MFSKILLPIDIAEPEVAKEAIDVAVNMAKAYNSSLRLVHVASPIVVPSAMAVIPQSLYDDLGLAEKAELNRTAAAIERSPETVSTTVRVGGIYPEVLAEAEEWGADLIVVGAHKPSMATYLLGSTAAAIVRHATCTVMVVRSARAASLL